MSLENYEKNKDRAVYLSKNYEDLNERDTRPKLRWGKTYEVHCRCCEDIYFTHIDAIVKRGYACKCGSWRISIYDTGGEVPVIRLPLGVWFGGIK